MATFLVVFASSLLSLAKNEPTIESRILRLSILIRDPAQKLTDLLLLFWCFVAIHPSQQLWSWGQSVHQTTPFPGQV